MVSLAERKCSQRDRDFGEQFRKQYVLSRDDARVYPDWDKTRLGGWTLHCGRALRLQPIRDREGTPVGWLLGYAFKRCGHVVEGWLDLDTALHEQTFATDVDTAIRDLSGRYVAIIICKSMERVYLDPVSDLPMLYDAQSQRVGSSLGVVLDREIDPNPDFTARKLLTGKQVHSLQHSLDRKVVRGISNHYLNLKDFRLYRHWPTEDMDLDVDEEASEGIIEQLCDRLQSNLAAYIRHFECVLPVTGGRDSRMLLAAALPHAAQIRQFACHRFHNPSRRDAKIAAQMLKTEGLSLTQYFKKPYSHTQIRDLRLRMGWSGWRGEMAALAMLEEYPKDHLILRGNIMEIIRATQWRGDTIGAPFRMRHAVRRLQMDKTLGDRAAERKWAPTYTNWLQSLPEKARVKTYDFAWTELHLPNHQGAYFNGFNNIEMINPFNDRILIALATSLPTRQRKNGTAVRKVIEKLHAPFLDIPFV